MIYYHVPDYEQSDSLPKWSSSSSHSKSFLLSQQTSQENTYDLVWKLSLNSNSIHSPDPKQDHLIQQKNGEKEQIKTSIIKEEDDTRTTATSTTKNQSTSRLFDTHRVKYYSSLLNKNIWTPMRIRPLNKTIWIFDWDDTLLCTSFLKAKQLWGQPLSDQEKTSLIVLEGKIFSILTLSLAKGDTYIVTNSSPGWVECTTAKYYPVISELLKSVEIISARDGNEDLYPNDYWKWKRIAFGNLVNKYDKTAVTNIICLGDSPIEIVAGKEWSRYFDHSCVKTVLFSQSPKIENWILQINIWLDKFEFICNKAKNWEIKINKKQ